MQIPKAHTKTANRSDGIPSRARPRGATRIGRNRYQKPNKSKILSFLLFYFVKVSPARAVTSSFLRKRRWRHPGCCVSKLCITPPPKNTEKNSQAPPPPIASSPYHEGGSKQSGRVPLERVGGTSTTVTVARTAPPCSEARRYFSLSPCNCVGSVA